ncbi:MAG: hypothetical protein SH821_07145 [Phototrophicales bacterium]|nr:hypothetical protein [Phototrophicales bacterium]
MNIIYTHQLNGNLTHFPRLFTHIRHISAQMPTKPLLLDLGGSCSPTQWHCETTEGRSVLIVLDAMGYHGANVADMLTPHSYAKLKDRVALALVHETQSAVVKDVLMAVSPYAQNGDAPSLKICLTAGDKTGFVGDWLHLTKIASDEVGVVQIDGDVVHQRIEKVPATTPSDPTISGVVDFVLAEARFYQSKR